MCEKYRVGEEIENRGKVYRLVSEIELETDEREIPSWKGECGVDHALYLTGMMIDFVGSPFNWDMRCKKCDKNVRVGLKRVK